MTRCPITRCLRASPPAFSTSPTSSTPASVSISRTASACSSAPICSPVGWLANREREKRHGATHLLQLQHPPRGDQRLRRELSVLLVRAAASPGDAGAYTMSLEEAWDKLRQRARPAAHRDPRRQRPASRSAVRLLHGAAARLQAHPAGHPPEVLHGRRDRVLRGSLRR